MRSQRCCLAPNHTTSNVSRSLQALESLAAASRLACLNAVDCSVTDDAVAALKKALPRLAVSHTRAPEGYWELVLTDSEVCLEPSPASAFCPKPSLKPAPPESAKRAIRSLTSRAVKHAFGTRLRPGCSDPVVR